MIGSSHDVISDVAVEQVGVDVHVKFYDSRSNRSRDTRLSHFVTGERRTKDGDRRS